MTHLTHRRQHRAKRRAIERRWAFCFHMGLNRPSVASAETWECFEKIMREASEAIERLLLPASVMTEIIVPRPVKLLQGPL